MSFQRDSAVILFARYEVGEARRMQLSQAVARWGEE